MTWIAVGARALAVSAALTLASSSAMGQATPGQDCSRLAAVVRSGERPHDSHSFDGLGSCG
jgi:hypothetical protein